MQQFQCLGELSFHYSTNVISFKIPNNNELSRHVVYISLQRGFPIRTMSYVPGIPVKGGFIETDFSDLYVRDSQSSIHNTADIRTSKGP